MSLISSNGSSPLPLLMVVEYLETPMSTDLLGKFPDNSAFDFNYEQSSIWSPLLPPPPPSDSAATDSRLQNSGRKLSYDENDRDVTGLFENTKKIAARIKRKFTGAVSDINISRWSKLKRRRRKSFGFSPVGSSRRLSSSSSSPKSWAKVIKAATKHFKKRKNKKKNSNINLDLSNYLKVGTNSELSIAPEPQVDST